MDVALQCAQCGTTATGARFCTTCGAPAPGPGVSPEALPDVVATGSVVVAAPDWQLTHVLPAAQGDAAEPAAPWMAPQPPAPASALRKGANALALLVVAALALSTWAILHGVEKHTLSGTILIADSSYSSLQPGDYCTGEGGYDDIDGGTQVVVADGKGATLSTGRLSRGAFDGLGCVFSFALQDVARADFYDLRIAGGNRGDLNYSYRELSGNHWSLQLSLGDD